jgi:uncharacterized protein (TIGR03437 family)
MPWLTVSRRVILPILLAAAVRAQCPNSIVAGPPSTYAGDGQPAISAWLFQPNALTLDASGNLYIADSGDNRIREVTTDGVMHTVAGPAGLNNPQFVLGAPNGSVYIADSGNNQIRLLSPSGVLTTIAGTGHPGYSGDNGAAAGAELNYPTGMALDSKGNVYFADGYNGVIRRIDTTGVVTTVATGMNTPEGIALAGDGTLFVADPVSEIIWRVSPAGAVSAFYRFSSATNLTLLPDGSLLIADGDLLRLSADGTTLSYYMRAGTATSATLGASGIYYATAENVVYRAASAASEPAIFAGQFYSGDAPDNVPALGAIFGSLGGIAVGPDGSIWVADYGDAKIRKILPNGTQRVVNSGIEAIALALDSAGNLYAAGGPDVWKVAANGTASLFAGGGIAPIPPVGAPAMPATSVAFGSAMGVAVDSAGNVYVLSDQSGFQSYAMITRITAAGHLTTIWDGSATAGTELEFPFEGYQGFAIDAQGYLLLPIALDHEILRIATDGSGVFQTLTAPDYVATIATAPSGEIFYQTDSNRIKALKAGATLFNRDIAPAQLYTYSVGAVSLADGFPVFVWGYSGGPFSSLATDAQGNVYFADVSVNAIRKFPVGPCFTVRAPQISVDAPVSPITPQPPPAPNASVDVYGDTFFAPGELVNVLGAGLGPKNGVNGVATNGIVGTQLSGVQVLFQGVPAPVLYASDGSINTVIPFSLYGYGDVLMQVSYNGVLSDAVDLPMLPSVPIVFTNGNPYDAVVANQDGSINSPTNPALRGSIITFYGSGFGLTTPAGIDGHLAATPLPKPVLPVSATVNGLPATMLYAGDAAGMVEGIVQVNLRLPEAAAYGIVNVVVGGNAMQFGMTIGGK